MIFRDQQVLLLGEISISPAALRGLDVDEICRAIDAHVCGEFSVVSDFSGRGAEKFLSVFQSGNGVEFHVATSATVTTVALAGERP
jgi:hypothetical protein